MSNVDIAFIIALPEEFRVLQEFVGEWRGVVDDDSQIEDYRFEIEQGGSERPLDAVACLVDDMGPGHASDATHRVLGSWDPHLIINVGIAASLKRSDVKLGDVVLVSLAKDYAAKGKISDAIFEPGGEYYRVDASMVNAVRHFEFSNAGDFRRWRESCGRRLIDAVPAEERDQRITDGHLRAEPMVVKAALASGPVVADSERFREWVHSSDRNIKALEMEAAGVLRAIASRPSRSKSLVIRGVSDFGDGEKSSLDSVRDGVFRTFAMQNCLELIWGLARTGRLSRQVSPVQKFSGAPRKEGGSVARELRATIQASIPDPNVSVTHLARLALALARTEGDSEFSEWLDREIQGYADDNFPLPEYRIAGVSSKMNGENPARRLTNYPIPMQNLEANIRASERLSEDVRGDLATLLSEMNTIKVNSRLAEVESYSAGTESRRRPWPDQLMSFTLPFIFNEIQASSAWQVIPPSIFLRVLEAVRSRIFDYVFPPKSPQGS